MTGPDIVKAIRERVWSEIEATLHARVPSPPKLLYHYTDANAILGIFNRRELWATHYAFMNDPSEGHQFRTVVSDTADRLAKEVDPALNPVRRNIIGNLG